MGLGALLMPTDRGRPIRGIAALLAAFGVVALALRGEFAAVPLFVGVTALIVLMWRALARDDQAALTVILLGLGVRLAVLGGIALSPRWPYLFNDEAGYAQHARGFVASIRGGADAFGTLLGPYGDPYVDVHTLLDLTFGELAAPIRFVNIAVSLLTGLLAYSVATSIFDRRAARIALTALMFIPSLVLWSVLDLRDSWIALLLVAILWSLDRLRRDPRWIWVIPVVVAMAWLEGLRLQAFNYLSLLVPVAALVAIRRERWRALVAQAVVLLVLVGGVVPALLGRGAFSSVVIVTPEYLVVLDGSRTWMARDARSAFVPETTPQVVQLGPGQVVQIEAVATTTPSTTASPTPSVLVGAATTPTPSPDRSPNATPPPSASAIRTPPTAAPSSSTAPAAAQTSGVCNSLVQVQPGSRVVVLAAGASAPPSTGGDVFVRPGDCVAYGPIGPSSPQPMPLPVAPEATLRVAPADLPIDTTSEDLEPGLIGQARRLLVVLGRGLVHVIAAPFPGLTRTGLELPALAEMIPWLIGLVAMLLSAVRYRRHWRRLFLVAGNIAFLIIGMALSEGNTGTLVRHRSMLMPFVFVLASPTLLMWIDGSTPKWSRFASTMGRALSIRKAPGVQRSS